MKQPIILLILWIAAVVGIIGGVIGVLSIGSVHIDPVQQHPELLLDDYFEHLGKQIVGFLIGGVSGGMIGGVGALIFGLVRLRNK